MRFSGVWICFLVGWSSVLLAQSPLAVKITYQAPAQSVSEALLALSVQASVTISYSDALLPQVSVPAMDMQGVTVEAILKKILSQTEIAYKVVGNQIVLYKRPPPPLKKHTISGFVKDAASGEPLIGANIFVLNGQGTSSNNYGFYSLTLPAGKTTVRFSYLGYQSIEQEIPLRQDTLCDVLMLPSLTLEPIIVTSDTMGERLPSEKQITQTLPLHQIEKLLTLGGEADIWRSAYVQAGVQTGTDGVGGLLVRGGSVDQNLVLLDGVPIYNPTHAVGLFSIFNADIIKQAKLYKGHFPARYGGRLSSVMDIRSREGNTKSYHGSATIGLISGKMQLEGPILKDKCSFFVAGRHSFTQWYFPEITRQIKATNARSLNVEDEERAGQSDYRFFDINAKLFADLSYKDKLYLSFYKGGDTFFDENILHFQDAVLFNLSPEIYQNVSISDTTQLGFEWGNTVSSLRWNHLFSNQLFVNTTFNYSQYNFRSEDLFRSRGIYDDGSTDLIFTAEKFRIDLENISVKTDWEYLPHPDYSMYVGMGISRQDFYPGLFFSNTQVRDVPLLLDSIALFDTLNIPAERAFESHFYVDNKIQLSKKLRAEIGVHAARWTMEGQHYNSIQPRLYIEGRISPKWSWSGAYTQMVQHIHFLTKSNLGLPGDVWVPSTARVAPERSWQATAGLYYTPTASVRFSLEGYYKKMDDIIAFVQRDSLITIRANEWEDNVAVGQGWSWGSEFSTQIRVKKLQVWLNYTLAWSERQFPEIKNNQRLPFQYDQRHSLNVVFSYDFTKKWSANATWILESGTRFTLPIFEYPIRTPGGTITVQDPGEIQAPAYHRLDMMVRYTPTLDKWEQSFSLGIFNIYNRANPIFYRIRQDNQLVQVTLLPFFPSLSYRLSF